VVVAMATAVRGGLGHRRASQAGGGRRKVAGRGRQRRAPEVGGKEFYFMWAGFLSLSLDLGRALYNACPLREP